MSESESDAGVVRFAVWEKVFISICLFLNWLMAPLFLFTNLILGKTRLNWLLLDLAILPFTFLTLPSHLFGKRGATFRGKVNAYAHIHFVCRSCPQVRRGQRDPAGGTNCAWNANWRSGNFDIPLNFGARNWVRQYTFKPTQLEEYTSLILPMEQDSSDEHQRIATLSPASVFSVVSSLLTWVLIVLVILAGSRLEYLAVGAEIGSAGDWDDLGPVPGADDDYPPQGITYWNGTLIFSNHWADTESHLYLIDSGTMNVIAEAIMPAEATHTSGLTYDGNWLWAVDYEINKLYQIDINATFETGVAHIIADYETGLRGTSAITYIDYGGVDYLAISDFFFTGLTHLIKLDQVTELEENDLASLSAFSYHNGWFSQGLTWDGEYLYETVNNLGMDRVEVIDVKSWLDGDDDQPCSVISFTFGGTSGEDLATDGVSMWSTDEDSFRLYRLGNYRAIIPEPNRCS